MKTPYLYLKVKQILIIFLSGLAMVNCDNKPLAIEESLLLESSMVVIKPTDYFKQVDISEIIDTVKFVTLELREGSLVGNIAKVIVFEDRIYIYDNLTYSIFVFNIHGEYIFKISRIGKGPGEYNQVDLFDIDYENRQIILVDLMGYWILRYDFKGNFISQEKIPIWIEGLAPTFNGGVVVYANHRDNTVKFSQEFNIYYLDSSMQVSNAYFPYNSNNFSNPRVKFSTSESGSFYTYDNDRYFFSHYKNHVYQVTETGLKPKYSFDFGKESFNEEYLNNKSKLKAFIDKGEFYGLGNMLENDDFVIYSFYKSSFPIGHFGFFAKKSRRSFCGTGFTIGENNIFHGYNVSTYDKWIIAVVQPDQLLSWNKNIVEQRIPLTNEYTKLKKIVAEQTTLEDNQVLMFYKLKQF